MRFGDSDKIKAFELVKQEMCIRDRSYTIQIHTHTHTHTQTAKRERESLHYLSIIKAYIMVLTDDIRR